jgi:hypothetical protein
MVPLGKGTWLRDRAELSRGLEDVEAFKGNRSRGLKSGG